MKTTTWIIDSAAPSSRKSARRLRECIEAHWHTSGEQIRLDFSMAQAVSEAYADELLGPLIMAYGLEVTFSRLRIDAPDPIARVFAVAVRRRLVDALGADAAMDEAKSLVDKKAVRQDPRFHGPSAPG